MSVNRNVTVPVGRSCRINASCTAAQNDQRCNDSMANPAAASCARLGLSLVLSHDCQMRVELPTGTVTFLFTDIEGSTRLLHELGEEAYADALAKHQAIVRGVLA